jgi:hypothetical protein
LSSSRTSCSLTQLDRASGSKNLWGTSNRKSMLSWHQGKGMCPTHAWRAELLTINWLSGCDT